VCTHHQLMISNVLKLTYIMKRTRRSFIRQAARIPAGLQDTRRSPSSAAVSGRGLSAEYTYGDDLKGSSQCRIHACTIHVREYILYIICKYWPRVFMPKECACQSVLYTKVYYVHIRIISYNLWVYRRRWMPSKLCA